MLTIQKEVLNDALNAVTRASQKSVLPVFALVRLDVTSDGILRLSCFNGQTAACAIMNVSCDTDMSICVDAFTLKAVVETLDGAINMSLVDNTLVIQSHTNRTTLHIVDEALPVIADEGYQNIATLSGSTLRSLLRVLPFASSDSARINLNLCYLIFNHDKVIAQAADGFSAGVVCESLSASADQISVSLPIGFARLLATMVEEQDTIRVGSSGDNRFIFKISNTKDSKDLMLATVSAAENFPSAQITTLIDEARKNKSTNLKVPQNSLAQSIRMVNAMGTQDTFIKVVSEVIKIASAETETGQARNILEGTASGADAHVWLSATFLKRAADMCKGEIGIGIADGKHPILIESSAFTAVIMPMLMDHYKDPFPDEEAMALQLPEMAMS